MSGGKRSAAGRKRGSVRASTRLQQTPREYGGGKLIPPLARSWNFLAGLAMLAAERRRGESDGPLTKEFQFPRRP